MSDRRLVLAGALAALALLMAGTAVILASTGMGVLGDTQCRSLLAENEPVCDEAVDRRVPWVVTAAVLAAVLVAATVTVLVRLRPGRGPRAPSPRARVVVPALVVVAASLALGWWGAFRLGLGNNDYCGSPITGAGKAPYDDDKPQRCRAVYHHKLLVGTLGLAGGVALVVVPAGGYVARSRADAVP